MITVLLIAMACLGNPDTTKTKQVVVKQKQEQKEVKQAVSKFDDSLNLLDEMIKKVNAKKAKEKRSNEQVKKD